jgi:hypothetical protein
MLGERVAAIVPISLREMNSPAIEQTAPANPT